MSAVLDGRAMCAQRSLPPPVIVSGATPEELATGLRLRFETYNDEFTLITRRAARHFQTRDWSAELA